MLTMKLLEEVNTFLDGDKLSQRRVPILTDQPDPGPMPNSSLSLPYMPSDPIWSCLHISNIALPESRSQSHRTLASCSASALNMLIWFMITLQQYRWYNLTNLQTDYEPSPFKSTKYSGNEQKQQDKTSYNIIGF